MGIIKRSVEIVKANVNDLLGRVEDPRKMLNQLMADLREEKRKAQLQVVRCVANEKKLEQEVRDQQEKLTQWQKRAEVAVMRDEDELAREAIQRRNEVAATVDMLTRQWEAQHQNSERLKDMLVQLEKRYKDAEFQKNHLIYEYEIGKANQQATQAFTRLGQTDTLEGFEKVRQKINETNALTSAGLEMATPELETSFARLESEGVIEHDLLQLKAQLGKAVPSLPSANGNGQAALPGAPANRPAPAPQQPEAYSPPPASPEPSASPSDPVAPVEAGAGAFE